MDFGAGGIWGCRSIYILASSALWAAGQVENPWESGRKMYVHEFHVYE